MDFTAKNLRKNILHFYFNFNFAWNSEPSNNHNNFLIKTNNMKNTENLQPEIVEEGKKFNLTIASIKVILICISVATVLFSAKAAFTDTVLESLERNYSGAISIHGRDMENSKKANQSERESADHACDAFRALKAYKESKKLALKNDYNPCVALAAPQEGF